MPQTLIASNRRANYDYEILETVEAGLVLQSSEIKSIRDNRVNLAGSYAFPSNGEMWLHNAHIAQYPYSRGENHHPLRSRKLLLKKQELRKYTSAAQQKGFSIVPLKLYISGHYAKITIGIGRGKRRYDKRKAIMEKERSREAKEAIKRNSQ
ncbi:MAG: SsrA-binding protein SmpB [SAR202 cluster bacterium]|jgi:SsrA-binding protein|nr:MAG: SsrA-binding protein SmpB [SAR202 cluster bacterium]MAR86059.1 SsrA-binding protein [Chloroflexota bacterium]PKB59994.1 MAG: SsrA-binding protein [SAR202 cluster bacterium Ae2-Chloro-G2]KAA1302253.1 MAG: SsrA-binding protein SmpB [SAR202 cluster bacterium]MEC7734459.1 SsrA-binding protein SmpB [Chloroflexota bacterium]|tara:strand:- start:538 stop:993 length:456 start_codon:yes stop_codon:yes gene_type:complete